MATAGAGLELRWGLRLGGLRPLRLPSLCFVGVGHSLLATAFLIATPRHPGCSCCALIDESGLPRARSEAIALPMLYRTIKRGLPHARIYAGHASFLYGPSVNYVELTETHQRARVFVSASTAVKYQGDRCSLDGAQLRPRRLSSHARGRACTRNGPAGRVRVVRFDVVGGFEPAGWSAG